MSEVYSGVEGTLCYGAAVSCVGVVEDDAIGHFVHHRKGFHSHATRQHRSLQRKGGREGRAGEERGGI